MEDTIKPKFELPPLTKDDLNRIKNADNYQMCKQIFETKNNNTEYEVGTAVYVRRKDSNKFVGQEYDNSSPPDKYIIIQNDEGFLFAKRILASGKPGVAVTCLTIDYKNNYYELVVDDEYVEAMLLDNQEGYDPTSAAKSLASRKNKATRENQKKRIVFDVAADAYAFIKTLKVGDICWGADYTYGAGLTEYRVDGIETRPAVAPSGSGWNRNRGDEEYATRGFKDYIKVTLKSISTTRRCAYDESFEFKHICKEFSYTKLLFKEKPVGADDFAK